MNWATVRAYTRGFLRDLGAMIAALGRGAWAAVDARDVQFYGGLALAAFAPWRVAVVGAALALYAAFGGALIARLARSKE